MSNDVMIRHSSWTFITSDPAGLCKELADRVGNFDGDEGLDDLLNLMGFGVESSWGADQRLTVAITGSGQGSRWMPARYLDAVAELTRDVAEQGSWLEAISEYDDDPFRMVLVGNEVKTASPEVRWVLPGDLGPWSLGAEAVREEVREAPELHDLTPEQAAAVIALDDTTINNAVQQSVDDSAWETFDRLRREVIGRLAQGAGSEDVGR